MQTNAAERDNDACTPDEGTRIEERGQARQQCSFSVYEIKDERSRMSGTFPRTNAEEDGVMSVDVKHLTASELEAGLVEIGRSPKDQGVLDLIVRRPQTGAREILQEGQLDLIDGLVGDTWRARASSRTPDHSPHPDTQLNIMNSRVIALVAQAKERWPLAGDQLFVDMDLTAENLPPGTRLMLGSAMIEVTSQPHTGCAKFMQRFGVDAMKFVNAPERKALNLRGINAKVIQPGVIHVGDVVKKVAT